MRFARATAGLQRLHRVGRVDLPSGFGLGRRMSEKFSDLLDEIHARDARYEKPAYVFVRGALDYTLQKMKERGELKEVRHISGQQLLGGIREFALEQFGPMAYTVLESWGIRETIDFGRIVFILIEHGVLGKRDEDRVEDFEDGFDFEKAFLEPYRPKQVPASG